MNDCEHDEVRSTGLTGKETSEFIDHMDSYTSENFKNLILGYVINEKKLAKDFLEYLRKLEPK